MAEVRLIHVAVLVDTSRSMGVAELSAAIDSAAALLRNADKAAYSSKQDGRNRVTVAP